MSNADLPSPPGLPESLPEGEHILWQQTPDWRPFSRRAFQFDKVAVYFLIVVGWVAISAFVADGWPAAMRSLVWSVPPSVGVLLVLALMAWLYARSTIYTITNKRVVIQSGLAVPSSVNLPFTRIDRADLKLHSDGTGDIELAMGGDRLLYSMLWPNLRLLRVKRPTPMLRALAQPQNAADILGRALAGDQPEAAASSDEAGAQAQERPSRRPITA